MIDFLEHLEKERGLELIKEVKKITKDYILVLTPLFFTTNEDRILLKKQKQHFQPILRTMKKRYTLELENKQDMYTCPLVNAQTWKELLSFLSL
jgi:chaperone required for assembly of F1-ATPase